MFISPHRYCRDSKLGYRPQSDKILTELKHYRGNRLYPLSHLFYFFYLKLKLIHLVTG